MPSAKPENKERVEERPASVIRSLAAKIGIVLVDLPGRLCCGENMAWNRRRYAEHAQQIERLNAAGDRIVVSTYLRPQLDLRCFALHEGLAAAGIPVIDTCDAST